MRVALPLLLVVCFLSALQVSSAAEDNLLIATKDAPLYTLSNFRTESDSVGNQLMAFDFTRIRKGSGSVRVRGKSKRGYLSIAAFISNSAESGTMRLKSLFPNRGNGPVDIEVFLALSHNWGGEAHYTMISNAVRLGDPGPTAKPRPWTPDEVKAYENHKRIMADDSAQKPRKSYPVSIDVTDDSQFLPTNAKVLPGTPLQACYSKKWNPLTTLSENKDGSINVRWDAYGATYDCSMTREELVIKKALLKKGAGGALVTIPTKEAKKLGLISDPPKPRKKYPVSIALPSHSERVPKDVEVKPGTRLQACYAGKWNPITALSENDDGTLNVRWDDYGAAFDCSMVREELIIRKSVLKNLPKHTAKASSASTDLNAIRTWTDASGAFKVRAKVVRKTDTTVTLLTEEGREVTVPISKFVEADQKLLRSSTTPKR